MLEILSVSTWALEPGYCQRAKSIILQRIEAGAGLENLGLTVPEKKKHRAGLYSGLTWDKQIGAYIHESNGQAVAHIPVIGTLTKRGGLCTSGSKEFINKIEQANSRADIAGIVLEIDGPGGDVDGTEALGNAIKNSKKPVVAYIDGLAASAHYWITSQANYIFSSSEKTSWIGSIGTLIVSIDESAWLEKQGLKIEIIRASQSVDKARQNSYEALTDELRAELVERLTDITDLFISTVKSGRGSKLTTEENIFTGKMYKGADALRFGLIDKIGTLQDAINKVIELSKGPLNIQNNIINKPKSEMFDIKKFFSKEKENQIEAQEETVNIAAAELNEVRANLEQRLQGTQASLEAANTENAGLTSRIQELEATAATLQGQLATAQATEQELRAQIEELEKTPPTSATGAHKENDEMSNSETSKDAQASRFSALGKARKAA